MTLRSSQKNATDKLHFMIKKNGPEKKSSKSKRPGRAKIPIKAKIKIVKEVHTAIEEIERRQRESVMHEDGSSEKITIPCSLSVIEKAARS
jgi:hypothetical protein